VDHAEVQGVGQQGACQSVLALLGGELAQAMLEGTDAGG
jgi:hypothetical protein